VAPSATYGVVVGTAGGDFTSRGGDDAQYNLFADAIRETFGTEVDLENAGGIRAPLVKGPIQRGDLVMMDPFSNTVITLKLTGRELKQVLASQRPYVAGLRYRLEGSQLVEASVDGRPIDDTRLYTVSTNSYFAGYAFKGLQTQDVQDTKRGRLDAVVDYVKQKGTVTPAYDGRRTMTR
jgi:2',3'-cyclic-nucleotide 2'-phosphodiesterase (5'-nucleotidase family)